MLEVGVKRKGGKLKQQATVKSNVGFRGWLTASLTQSQADRAMGP